MMPFTYLLIDFFTVVVCFIASFDKRIQFNNYFAAFLKAAVLVAIPFIAWDIWFTSHGAWWFNLDYTIGLTIAGLPVEEWLFFICIPFACVFTFFCLDKFFRLNWANGFNNIIVFVSVILFTVTALLNYSKIYTLLTAIATIFTLIYLHFIARAEWIGRASFTYLVLMLGFFPVNGILTGTGVESPIVNYNPDAFLGIRMLSIPIEDAVYGYTQFLLVLYFFKIFSRGEKADMKLNINSA